MPVLAPLKPFLDAMVAAADARDDRPVAERRAAMHAMIDASFSMFVPQVAPAFREQDHQVPVEGGTFTARVYAPEGGGGSRPCHVNFHGGGFWLGTLEQSDAVCRGLVADVGCVVVSVDYRLAPENKYPAAAEDGYAALLWVVDQAAALGVDPSKISVGGASAGGNLAAVVALMARDRGGPALVFQVLEIPVTDFTRLDSLSVPEEALVIPSGKAEYRDFYLADPSEAVDPYASPLLAPDLAGLPPALILCAEYDPLAAEGEAYARRLEDAGVPVEFRNWPGQFHGSQTLAALIPAEAEAYRLQIAGALRQAFGTETTPSA